MDAPTVEGMESSMETITQEASSCPMHALHTQRVSVEADDALVFPHHKRVVTAYAPNTAGDPELHLYYGEKEIVFDEPDLFAFGEGLTKQTGFIAKTATTWGEGYAWPRVQALLAHLLAEGILQRARTNDSARRPHHGAQPSPLPVARTMVPRTWFDCEAITRELTGHPVEAGYVELLMPIYRVAHIAMDAEGRQVGEANVFPTALRLDVPTEWRTCPYPGSRYQDASPMNITALRSVNKYWQPMMVALLHIRDAYLRRFPRAQHGWTVGDMQRFSTLVLAVPTYLLMRTPQRVENGHLHPVLSSMFRITDGVRLTMHHMLFTSTDEPTLAPDAPITSADIYAYAERNNHFLSDSGVCASPRTQIEAFLRVFLDGQPGVGTEAVELDAPVQAALAALDGAFDYGLYGLQAYAVRFSLGPVMSRTYERLWAIVEAWAGEQTDTGRALRARLQRIARVLPQTLLGTEEQRGSHERVYADMYTQCARGLGVLSSGETLAERLRPTDAAHHGAAAERLRAVVRQRLGGRAVSDSPEVEQVVVALMDYFCQEQVIVRVACAIQQRINQLLGRTPPTRPFTAADFDLYYQLQDVRDLPYLGDELAEVLGLQVVVRSDAIEIVDRSAV